MLIDRFLPAYDVTHVCETLVAAPPDVTYAAIRATDLRDPLIGAMFALRELPLHLARRLRGDTGPGPGVVTAGDIAAQAPGWATLAEQAGVELVLGSVGRFWQHDYGSRAITAAEFIPFAEPGYAKLAVSFHVRSTASGPILRYEARTATTDAAAQRRFRRYWRVIAPGAALVMRRVLRRIKSAAESSASSSSGPAEPPR